MLLPAGGLHNCWYGGTLRPTQPRNHRRLFGIRAGRATLVSFPAATFYDITITRRKPATPPKIALVGVGADGRLAMTADRAAFEWPIIVRRDDTYPLLTP